MQIALIYFSEQKLNVMLDQYLTSQGNWLKFGYKNVTSVCYLPNKAKKIFFPMSQPISQGNKQTWRQVDKTQGDQTNRRYNTDETKTDWT